MATFEALSNVIVGARQLDELFGSVRISQVLHEIADDVDLLKQFIEAIRLVQNGARSLSLIDITCNLQDSARTHINCELAQRKLADIGR